MNSLKLITTKNFENISCDFYRNMNDDILLTREQIGTALEYSNPGKAIQKIHLKHKDRLDPLSMKCKEIRYPQSGGAGIPVEITYYTNLFLEFQNLYPDIDLAQMQDDYCFENKLDSCYTMDAIEHNKEIRNLFEHMVNDLLDRYKLKSDPDEEYTVRKTIFV